MGSYYSGMMNTRYDNELKHHGIIGQKWGIRRFQNPDGSLTPAGRERYGKSSTSNRSDFDKNVYKASEDPRQKNRINNFFKSGSNQAKNITDRAEAYKNASMKLDEAFLKYDKILEKERGKTWDGDGTEEHWELEERYPEYKAISETEKKAKRELLSTIKDASSDGTFDDVINSQDYEWRDSQHENSNVYKNDGKAGVMGYYLAEKYNFPFFHEDLETISYVDKKSGKEKTYWPAFDEYVDNSNPTPSKDDSMKKYKGSKFDGSPKAGTSTNPQDYGSAEFEKNYKKYQRLQGTKSLLGGDHSKDESVKVLTDYQNEIYKNRNRLRNKEKSDYKNSVADIASKYTDKYAKAVLKDMGYDTSPESIAWLRQQPWFYLGGASEIVF